MDGWEVILVVTDGVSDTFGFGVFIALLGITGNLSVKATWISLQSASSFSIYYDNFEFLHVRRSDTILLITCVNHEGWRWGS